MEILLITLALTYLFSLLFGFLLEKFKVPWIFSALVLGLLISIFLPSFSSALLQSGEFNFLAKLGMMFLLFIIGFELDLKKFKRLSKFILLSALFIILLDGLFGTLLLKGFGYNWLISLICALSFATVGEAVLIPILEEFNLVKTKFGTVLIGIGTLDDLVEVFTIFLAASLIGVSVKGINWVLAISMSLCLIFAYYALLRFKKQIKRTQKIFPRIEDFFLFTLFVFFLFTSIGSFSSLETIGALLAGIGTRNFLPKNLLEIIEESIKFIGYGFFGLIFFLWVGLSINFFSIAKAPLLTFLILLVGMTAKILASVIAGRKEMGMKKSILLGIGLSVRFSTGLIITSLLFTQHLIDSLLFSSLVAASTLSTLIIPFLFSFLIKKMRA